MSSGFWGMLHDRDAGLVLNGHAHRYERFAARTPGGRRSAEGIDRSSPGPGGRGTGGGGEIIHAVAPNQVRVLGGSLFQLSAQHFAPRHAPSLRS